MRFWQRLGVFSLCAMLLLVACGRPTVRSLADAEQIVRSRLMPKVSLIENRVVSDAAAARYNVEAIREPLPEISGFPLYAAQPGSADVFVEILSSPEKANPDRLNESWLVDVATAFNASNPRLTSGESVRVGVRRVSSGLATRILAAGEAQPQAFSPSNDFWLEMLRADGLTLVPIASELVPNTAGFVISEALAQRLGDQANFPILLNTILSGGVALGYPNPYTSSTALNLLYTILWYAADHNETGGGLSLADLESPAVNSVFAAFQDQVTITTGTTLDLQELFIRSPASMEAFPLEYQNFLALKELAEFRDVSFIPFGVAHSNSLVGFDWNNANETAALRLFATYAATAEARELASQMGFEPLDRDDPIPPLPAGSLLLAAQSFWKRQKDGDRTVYMMIVVDTSGSMSGEPLRAVQDGLRIASQSINAGNHVGMVGFGGQPYWLVPLAPFDRLHHQRLLAGVDSLSAQGFTAMYDGLTIALDALMTQRASDPNGRFYILLLSDGETNRGWRLPDMQGVLEYSDIRIYPIAYDLLDQPDLVAIAATGEASVQRGNTETITGILRDIFQTSL